MSLKIRLNRGLFLILEVLLLFSMPTNVIFSFVLEACFIKKMKRGLNVWKLK